MSNIQKLFDQGSVSVVNVGLPSFAEDLRKQGIPVVHVDWKPPAGGNKRIQELLDKVARSQARFRKS